MAKIKQIGILTAGGDSPGLNAAIRGVGKAALDCGIKVIGFKDGFRGLVDNQCVPLDRAALSGILTIGGTILGTGERGSAKVIDAHVPLSEMFGYATDMRSMTQGRASYSMEPSHYAKVPKNKADEVIAERTGGK